MTKRIVAFLPNFEPDLYNGKRSYSGINYGFPKHYTHVIIGFIVPYHFYTKTCSGLCNLSSGTYFDGITANDKDPQAESDRVMREIISGVRAQNPNTKILFSFGGFFLDNTRNSSDSSKNMYCEYVNNEQNTDPLNMGPTNSSPVPPSDKDYPPSYYCVKQGYINVANHLLAMTKSFGIDGIDLDFEGSWIYNDLGNPQRNSYLQFYKNLVAQLRDTDKNLILTVSPQSPYVVSPDEIGDQTYSNAYQFYNDWLKDSIQHIDFMNVQFYNNSPEDTDPSIPATTFQNIFATLCNTYSPQKIVFGMCAVKEDDGVCKTCTFNNIQSTVSTDSHNLCNDPTYRFNNIIKPLYEAYRDKFGGIMFWNTAGDPDGSFSKPFKELFYGASTEYAGVPSTVNFNSINTANEGPITQNTIPSTKTTNKIILIIVIVVLVILLITGALFLFRKYLFHTRH